MSDLPERIKKLREEKSLTQANVASHIHVSRPTYTEYELGKKRPSIETLMKLADFYKVSLDYLTGRYS